MIRFFKRKTERNDAEKKTQAIMDKVKEATRQGQCVILAETSEGTRIIVLGKSTMQTQLDQIARDKGVIL